MAENPLDKLFKDKLAHREFEYHDDFWNEAVKGMDVHRKKNQGHFLTFLVMTLIIATGIWLGFRKSDQEKVSDAREMVYRESIEAGQSQSERVSSGSNAGSLKSPIKNKTAENTPLKIRNTPGPLKNDNALEGNPFSGGPGNRAPGEEIANPEKPGLLPESNNEIMEEQAQSSADSDSDVHPGDISGDTDNAVSRAPTGDTSTAHPDINSESVPDEDHVSRDVLQATTDSLQESTVSAADQPLAGSNPSGTQNQINLRWGVSGFAGIHYAHPVLRSHSETGSEYIKRRKDNTSNGMITETGLLANAYYGKWSMSTGAVAGSYRSQTHYEFRSTLTTYDSNYIKYLDSFIVRIDSNGGRYDTTWFRYVKDTVLVDSHSTVLRDSGQESLNGKVLYRYVEIPLMFTREFPLNNRTTGFIRSGVSVGILRSVSGYQVDPISNKMTAIRQKSFRKTFYFATMGGGVAYEMNPSLSIYAEGVIKWNITDLLVSSEYSQRLNGYGIRLGLNYRF